MKNVVCNFCGSSNYRIIFPEAKNYYMANGPQRVVQCLNCGLIFTNPQPSPEETDKIYPQDYYGEKNVRFVNIIEYISLSFRKYRARGIIRFKKNGTILDVGCGRGDFLESMKNLGWEIYGIEISQIGANRAKAIFKDRILIGDLLDINFPSNFFDCVSLFHVLEHTRQPREIIRKIYKLLKPQGIFLVAVPNIDCLSFKIFKSNWFGFAMPQNDFYFSLGLLSKEIRESGFIIKEIKHFSLEQDPFSLMQSFLNFITRNDDFLYRILHKDSDIKNKFLCKLITILLGCLFFIPALIFSFIFSIIHRGGTIEIYAYKP